jgi:hypothetical protein
MEGATYGIRAANNSGLIATNNAIISPTANPTIMPAARYFLSLVVISTPGVLRR